MHLFALFLLVMSSWVAAPPPNVVLILADDLGYSDLGCYGSEIQTPSLDRLAQQGVRFSQFYNTARCSPTRASLLTGLYPHAAGVGWLNRDEGLPGYRGELSAESMTLADLLRQVGYKSYLVGKWHLTSAWHRLGASRPLNRGFDGAFGVLAGGSHFAPRTLFDGHRLGVEAEPGFYSTDAFSDRAIQYLREHDPSKGPFFLYLAYTAPHFPLHAHEKDTALYRGKYLRGWDELRGRRLRGLIQAGILPRHTKLSPRDEEARDWDDLTAAERGEWDLRMAVYAAMITAMDRGIGRVVAEVDRQGLRDNTIFLFLSDNGASAEILEREPVRGAVTGSPESFRCVQVGWSNASNTPFRRHKMWTHEGGIATPLIISWPRRLVGAGRVSHLPGHVIDIFPTLLEISGAHYPEENLKPLAGRSLLPELEARGESQERMYFWEHEGNRAVRNGDWKLVAERDGLWELYDLSQDRTELHDLARNHPQRVQDMSRLYRGWAQSQGVVALDALPKRRTPPGYRRR